MSIVADKQRLLQYAETRDRTGDLQIFSLTLSQLSYRGCAGHEWESAKCRDAPTRNRMQLLAKKMRQVRIELTTLGL